MVPGERVLTARQKLRHSYQRIITTHLVLRYVVETWIV